MVSFFSLAISDPAEQFKTIGVVIVEIDQFRPNRQQLSLEPGYCDRVMSAPYLARFPNGRMSAPLGREYYSFSGSAYVADGNDVGSRGTVSVIAAIVEPDDQVMGFQKSRMARIDWTIADKRDCSHAIFQICAPYLTTAEMLLG